MRSRDLPAWKILLVTHLTVLLVGLYVAWFLIPHQPSEQYVSEPAMFKKAGTK